MTLAIKDHVSIGQSENMMIVPGLAKFSSLAIGTLSLASPLFTDIQYSAKELAFASICVMIAYSNVNLIHSKAHDLCLTNKIKTSFATRNKILKLTLLVLSMSIIAAAFQSTFLTLTLFAIAQPLYMASFLSVNQVNKALVRPHPKTRIIKSMLIWLNIAAGAVAAFAGFGYSLSNAWTSMIIIVLGVAGFTVLYEADTEYVN